MKTRTDRTQSVFAVLALLGMLLPAYSSTFGATPTLSRIMPRGAQRGTEITVVFSGSRLKDARSVFYYRNGIETTKIEPVNDKSVKIHLKIAPDAPLGEHPMRVRTATGVTELRTFYVGPFPTIAEKEPNSEFAKPQPIKINSTVTGVVQNEDVDYYVVDARKGQRLSAEVEAIRLGVTMFDCYVSIMDAKRFDLAASDDSSLLLQDPVTSIIVPEDGKYIIQVRESSYAGNGNCLYRLHVGTFPRPMVIYPPGGKIGQDLELKYIGDVKGDLTRKIKLPNSPESHYGVFVDHEGQTPPSPNYLRVSTFDNVLEKEPNDNRKQSTVTDLALPVALNGIIEKKGDQDWFRFKAKKGQQFNVRVYARALRSPLDPVLNIYYAGGARVVGNDDQGGPDSQVRFKVPKDGEYELRVTDHLGNGGPNYIYRVEFNAIKPSVYTHIPAYDREPRGQTRQWVVVPRGNRFVTWVRVNRSNFGGDMKLAFENLPKGITAHADTIAGNVDRVPVVFEAAADAPIEGSLADIVATHADPKQKISGKFHQNVNLVFGSPNNTVYYRTDVKKLAVTVAEESPFKIRIIEPKAPIVRNGTMGIRVVAERKKGFTKAITLRLLWRPPGIGARGSISIPAGKNEAVYSINANGSAPTRTWKIAVLGYADGGHGTVWVSSQLANLSVTTPYVGMKIEMAAAEQGKPAEIVCKLDQHKPFQGNARVILHGLPARVTAETREKQITKDDKEVVFAVKTDPKSPAGQHKSLFCQIIITEQGEPVNHSVGGGGILRIDPPPPPKKKKPKPAPKPAAKKVVKKPEPKKAVKRLTRLEKLRLEAQERAKEAQEK